MKIENGEVYLDSQVTPSEAEKMIADYKPDGLLEQIINKSLEEWDNLHKPEDEDATPLNLFKHKLYSDFLSTQIRKAVEEVVKEVPVTGIMKPTDMYDEGYNQHCRELSDWKLDFLKQTK